MFRGPNDFRPSRWFVAWFGLCAVLAVVAVVVFIWAVITVVSHLT